MPTTPRALLRARLAESGTLFAPLCLDALTSRLCEELGFGCGYLSGGALGYATAISEALLGSAELADAARAITRRSGLPLIADIGVGFGDAVHAMRATWDLEAAGAAAVEIEDQVAPKRASHHRGIEHVVPTAEMVAKLAAVVASRRDPELVVIARTSAMRHEGFDAAIERLNAYAEAGADLLLFSPTNEEELERAPKLLTRPAVTFSRLDARPRSAWSELGYAIVLDPYTGQSVAHEAVRRAYRGQLAGEGSGWGEAQLTAIYRGLGGDAGLEDFYEVERNTTEPGT